jgi:hypothetical protein
MDVVRAIFGDGLDDFASFGRVHEVECWVIDAHYTVERLEFTKSFQQTVDT